MSFMFSQRKRPIQKVEMGTSSQNDVDMSWIPQETLNQISKQPQKLGDKCFYKWELVSIKKYLLSTT